MMVRRRLACLLLTFFAVLLLSLPAAAQEEKAETPPAEKEAKVDPALAEALESPRSTLRFLIQHVNKNEWEIASQSLDLSELDQATAGAKASLLAYRLKAVIDRMVYVEWEQVIDQPDWPEDYSLASLTEVSDSENVAWPWGDDERSDAQKIIFTRGKDKLWRFSSSTVADIDGLWNRWEGRAALTSDTSLDLAEAPFEIWLERRFPKSLRSVHFLLPGYQWICLAAIVFLGFLIDLLTRLTLAALTKVWFRYVHADVDRTVQRGLWKPVGLLAQAFVWYWATSLIGLPNQVLMVLLISLKFFTVVAAVWTVFRFIDLLASFLQGKASLTTTKFDDLLIPLVQKSLKGIAVCVGLVFFADMFNLEWTGLLGGLGIGGAAIAFASKDALGNIFGSITVLTDRPFEIGDWIIADGVEGSVETVGLRSTRVRTFYNSLVTIPNSTLTTAVVDNMGQRRYRRIKTTLGLQYDSTPEQIDAFCEAVRELLRRHPYTRKDYYHVYFNSFGDSSLNILLYCFLECPDWSIELRERHRLFLDIMRVADRVGVSFAFPTRTLHMFQEEHAAEADATAAFEKKPEAAGRRIAAEIAGPLVTGEERPGGVDYPGPSKEE